MNQILITIAKPLVIKARARLDVYIGQANKVGPHCNMTELREAYTTINIAKGVFYTLHGFGLIEDGRTAEDIDRVENKVLHLVNEKIRKGPGRQSIGPDVNNQDNSKSN